MRIFTSFVTSLYIVFTADINVKNEVYKSVIGDVVAHIKTTKFTILPDL